MIDHTIAQYRILQHLGGGSMGVVYRARDTRLGRTVALKLLPAELSGVAGAKERFLREARAASRLDHPNICTVYELGETADGHLYIAMAFYDGETLKQRIARGPLPARRALEIGWQIARALAEAHSLGIVHRDVKPANVLVTRDDEAKVLDFGLAQLAGEAALTRTGSSIGTPVYMSPEQIGGKTDARTDVWSLGVLLFEMLTGLRPFDGGSPAATMYHILNREPRTLEDVRPGLPEDLQPILNRALAKDPDRRYATMAEFAEVLAVACSTEATVTQPMLTLTPGEPAGTPASRRAAGLRRLRIAAALAGAAAILTGALKLWWPDAGGRPPARAERDPRLAEAQAAYASGDGERAERLFREVVDGRPDNAGAWSGLAATTFHYGPLDGRSRRASRPAWQRVEALAPGDLEARLHLARLDLYDRDFPRLQARLQRLEAPAAASGLAAEALFFRAHLPAGAAARDAVARRLSAAGLAWLPESLYIGSSWIDPELWLLAIEPAGTPRERAHARRLLGTLQLALGRLEAADEELRRASPLPGMPEEHAALAATVPFLPVPRPRLEALRDAVADWPLAAGEGAVGFSLVEPHAPNSAHLRAYLVGLLSARLGDTAAALAQAAELVSLGEAPGALGLHLDLAAGVRAEVARLAGDSEDVLVRLGQRRGRYNHRLAVFSPLFSRVRERWLRAEALLALGRLEEAEGWYESLAELGLFDLPYLPWSYLRRGEIAQRLGRPQQARDHYGRFLRLWRDCDAELRPRLAEAEAAILASD